MQWIPWRGQKRVDFMLLPRIRQESASTPPMVVGKADWRRGNGHEGLGWYDQDRKGSVIFRGRQNARCQSEGVGLEDKQQSRDSKVDSGLGWNFDKRRGFQGESSRRTRAHGSGKTRGCEPGKLLQILDQIVVRFCTNPQTYRFC